jgi:hypothetical protein
MSPDILARVVQPPMATVIVFPIVESIDLTWWTAASVTVIVAAYNHRAEELSKLCGASVRWTQSIGSQSVTYYTSKRPPDET